MHGPRTALIWRAVFALLGWAILALQYALMLATLVVGLNFFTEGLSAMAGRGSAGRRA